MRFSEVFGISRQEADDWFDPILSVDVRLFIDPFLLYAQAQGPFDGSHDEVIAFFDDVFHLVASTNGRSCTPEYRRAVDLLRLPEVGELCLGYTLKGTRGSGSGIVLAKLMAGGMWAAILGGLEKISHFEEIAIFQEGIGADRISDIAAGLLRHRLATYTKAVCERHGVHTSPVRYPRGVYDGMTKRWLPLDACLPTNPYTKRPVLLVPSLYLKPLPTINADAFWNYCFSNENETLRHQFGDDITANVNKPTIVELARLHAELCEDYVSRVEQRPAQAYDLEHDGKLAVRWYDAARDYCGSNPRELQVDSIETFGLVIEQMVQAYRHFVEENSGWRLLWNDNHTPRSEDAAQNLFLGIVKHYCHANDIDISREADIGRGPVDFKVSHGYNYRSLLELKLAKNTKFWAGHSKQLPTYQKAEGTRSGYFLVIVYSDTDANRVADIQAKTAELNRSLDYVITSVIVDARPKKSASKLK